MTINKERTVGFCFKLSTFNAAEGQTMNVSFQAATNSLMVLPQEQKAVNNF